MKARQQVTSLNLLYWCLGCYFRRCSSQARSTRYCNRLHDFSCYLSDPVLDLIIVGLLDAFHCNQGVIQAVFEIGNRFWAHKNWRPDFNELIKKKNNKA